MLHWIDCLFYLSTSEASISAGGMSDKDREHARIMARLEELEMEEEEAGSTSEEEDDEEDDEGAGSSEDVEEIEEPGDALSDSNVQLGSGFGASCSGSDGNAKSHGNIQVFISS
jgi:unconventional prefoldin RPB5 interactor 1